MESKISITASTFPIWDHKTKEDWLKFKEWVEANGGEFEEEKNPPQPGLFKITFKPIERRGLHTI